MIDLAPTDNNKIIDPSELPVDGYEMGSTESIGLVLSSGGEHDKDGILTDRNDEKSPYKKIAHIRLGGHETYEYLDLVTIASPGTRFEQTGIPALLRRSPEGEVTAVLYGQLYKASESGVVGRSNELFAGLPDTVSHEHISLEWDKEAGILLVRNLNPDNKTVLFPAETPEDSALSRPDGQLEVAIVPDPQEHDEGTIEEIAAAAGGEEARITREKARLRRRRLTKATLQRTMEG